jgi:WD40 repeat protein
MLSSSWDYSLKVWDVRTGRKTATLEGHVGTIPACVFSPDARRVLSASRDGTFRVWDPDTGCQTAVYYHNRGLSGIVQGRSGGSAAVLDDQEACVVLGLAGFDIGEPIVTAVCFYDPDRKKLERKPAAKCPWCVNRFSPSSSVLDTIRAIARNLNLASERSIAATLPEEAWDEPSLLSKCSHCGLPVRFNPFLVDNPNRTLRKP